MARKMPRKVGQKNFIVRKYFMSQVWHSQIDSLCENIVSQAWHSQEDSQWEEGPSR